MGRWLIFSTLFLVAVSFSLMPLYAQKKGSPAADEEKDVEELEALIEGRKGPQERPPQERKPAAKAPAKEEEGSFYKSFGNDMSIRGDGKYFYIKAKDTVITVDASGHVQIEAADNILMKSKRSITLQADENIHLVSGDGVVQSKLESQKLSEKKEIFKESVETETEEEASKEPAAQLPPKAEAAEEELAEVEKKKVQEPSTAPETEESEILEESETESGSVNE
ncbi:MAG: hypothetical protein AAB309_06045 [Deltaproteobacteria bacterium]